MVNGLVTTISELVAVTTIWVGFWTYWLIRARATVADEKTRGLSLDRVHQTVVIASLAVMLGALRAFGIEGPQVLRPWDRLGLSLTIFGLGFSVWAREYLGQFWSGAITKKEGHQIIQSGPYSIVRHPIYTGFLIATLGTAVASGRAEAFVALAIFWASYILKVRREDAWLKAELGPPYQDYARRVKGLIPGVV